MHWPLSAVEYARPLLCAVLLARSMGHLMGRYAPRSLATASRTSAARRLGSLHNWGPAKGPWITSASQPSRPPSPILRNTPRRCSVKPDRSSVLPGPTVPEGGNSGLGTVRAAPCGGEMSGFIGADHALREVRSGSQFCWRDARIAASSARCRDRSELNVGTHGYDAALWQAEEIYRALRRA
jgi:hypothetical protein